MPLPNGTNTMFASFSIIFLIFDVIELISKKI